jgi:hypothetical protein
MAKIFIGKQPPKMAFKQSEKRKKKQPSRKQQKLLFRDFKRRWLLYLKENKPHLKKQERLDLILKKWQKLPPSQHFQIQSKEEQMEEQVINQLISITVWQT